MNFHCFADLKTLHRSIDMAPHYEAGRYRASWQDQRLDTGVSFIGFSDMEDGDGFWTAKHDGVLVCSTGYPLSCSATLFVYKRLAVSGHSTR